MKNIYNAVEFSTLCMFAEEQKMAHYNAAHEILFSDAYPHPEDQVREIYYDEMQYARNPKAAEILTRYMESKGVRYINVLKE